jgi:eukaryotic-like serine/threonine-protein kinase
VLPPERKPPTVPPPAGPRASAELVTTKSGDVALVQLSGLVDEHFTGFGDVGGIKTLVLDVSGLVRMTSFGVRQWLLAMEALPKTLTNLYLLGCPTFFVDQLNMVLNFGGAAKVLTVAAPFMCIGCGAESAEAIDVLVGRADLAKGVVPRKMCSSCGGTLDLDETPQSYFAFVSKYGATSIVPAAAQMLAVNGLYVSADFDADKPPKIIKLVRGSVTYFRIAGTMSVNFRARPLLGGSEEGEVVIDLADVTRFDIGAHNEWRRLIRTLSAQVSAVTLVDVDDSFFAVAADTLLLAPTIAVSSVRAPYACMDCSKSSDESIEAEWPLELTPGVCTTCGGTRLPQLSAEAFAGLQSVRTQVAQASARVIVQRDELVSRALTDARVAEAAATARPRTPTSEQTILGKYQIVRPLSEGGMAEVFLAQQVGLEKPVALKRIQRKLLESRHLAIDMFLNEAKIAGRLTHPNIVQVLDVGEVGGVLYLAMEYVKGHDLREVINKSQKLRHSIPTAVSCHIIREVALALHYAYFSHGVDDEQLSVVHRDVSPQNIILGDDGAVKLLDFGVAMSSVTEHEAGMIVGKWRYISPEATMKNRPIDHRSDLFSLGVILYLMCTGVAPFSARDPKDIVKKIRAGEYRPVHEAAPKLPRKLANLIESMLDPSPELRPQSGMEVAAQLEEIARQEAYVLRTTAVAGLLDRLFGTERAPDVAKIEILRPTVSEGKTRGSASISVSAVPRSRTSTRGSNSGIGSNSGLGSKEPTTPPPIAQVVTLLPTPRFVPPQRGLAETGLSRRAMITVGAVMLVVIVALYLIVRPS